jgi:hypothetical protein
MSGRQRSALSLVPDHNGRHHQDRAVRRDIGVVATLSWHTSCSGPTEATLAGARLPQHDLEELASATLSDTTARAQPRRRYGDRHRQRPACVGWR